MDVGKYGFPGGSVVKNLPANAREAGSVLGSGRSPGEGDGKPLQYSCLGNPMVRRTWQAIVRGVTKSQTRLSDWIPTQPHIFNWCSFKNVSKHLWINRYKLKLMILAPNHVSSLHMEWMGYFREWHLIHPVAKARNLRVICGTSSSSTSNPF